MTTTRSKPNVQTVVVSFRLAVALQEFSHFRTKPLRKIVWPNLCCLKQVVLSHGWTSPWKIVCDKNGQARGRVFFGTVQLRKAMAFKTSPRTLERPGSFVWDANLHNAYTSIASLVCKLQGFAWTEGWDCTRLPKHYSGESVRRAPFVGFDLKPPTFDFKPKVTQNEGVLI